MKKFMAIFAVVALVAFAAPAFAATNPFMDVPAGHWAYDAVAQLASRGVVSGYPDGAYKGSQPTTRYEMASVVARALAAVDMDKASQRDVDLLKRLVLEFKNELDALGVKVSDLDKRVALLEDGIGGWKIRGIFRFDAMFGDSDSDNSRYTVGPQDNEFSKERFRLFLTKTIDENTYFYAQYRTGGNFGSEGGRGDQAGGRWTHLYVDTKLPWDIGLRVGRFAVDFEDAYGLYIDNDAIFGDFRADGFLLNKSFGNLNATAAVARNIGRFDDVTGTMGDYMAYILDLNFRPNEKFFLGATGYWGLEDGNGIVGDWDINTYGIYAGYSFTPSIALKGIYYFQDLGDNVAGSYDDSPAAWKAIIDIKQEALKFTSLWIEYSEQDNNFKGALEDRYSIGGTRYASVGDNIPVNDETTSMWFVYAKQQWNPKLNTFLRYAQADYDTAGIDDAKEFGGGIGYQYTPALYFELAYDQVDYGTGVGNKYQDKESVIRFRTTVNF